jgi:hypothetical protein
VAGLEVSQVNRRTSVTRKIANLLFMRFSPFSAKASQEGVKPLLNLPVPQVTYYILFANTLVP